MNWKDSNWYRQAKDLPIGSRLRMPHEDCSIGDTLQVTVKREGVFAYCHLCKESMFVHAAALSLAERAALLASQEATDKVLEKGKALPLPKTENPSEWPIDARVWIYKAGITNAEIISYGIYYHAPSNRVVIPIRDGGRDTGFWQARSATARPKYLNPSGFNRSYIVQYFLGSSDIVLVEDWLSSYRISRATGYSVYALLGTNLSDPIAARLVERKTRVFLWFDNDKAGKDASSTIKKKLNLYGIETITISSERDPKTYSDEEIRGILYGH